MLERIKYYLIIGFSSTVVISFSQAAAIKKYDDKRESLTTFKNAGKLYSRQGSYAKALDVYYKTLAIAEELKDTTEIATGLANIANINRFQGDYNKALNNSLEALAKFIKLKNDTAIAKLTGGIGAIYWGLNDFPLALKYFFRAVKLNEKLNNTSAVARQYTNIGATCESQAEIAMSRGNTVQADSLTKEALYYAMASVKLNEKIGNVYSAAIALGNVGSIYFTQKNYGEAEKYVKKSLSIFDSLGSKDYIKHFEKILSEIYENTNEPTKALEHYKKYIQTKDSIFNEENTKKSVRAEMNFEFEKKQAIAKAEQEKIDAIASEEKKKQKFILIVASCFLAIVLLFATIMFRKWQITQKQKQIIEKQKEKIIDSINYAQLIQQSILIEESEIQKLLPDSFIYFLPKNIVSGDFYWFSAIGDKIILAAIDCTGHGVPGAFMSMIGNAMLNQIVNEKRIANPAEILRQLHLGVYEALHQNKEGELSGDGMDVGLCIIDYKNNELQYAGARNPLYIVKDNELIVIEPNRQTIGSDLTTRKNISTLQYTNHSISIRKGMSIYLFSDGYMDQLSGKENKKFGMQKFKALLLSIQKYTMKQQNDIIIAEQKDWRGNIQQTDDVLIIGVKL
jgi:serine phosphatase RsbU (regulator of sigma subunit)